MSKVFNTLAKWSPGDDILVGMNAPEMGLTNIQKMRLSFFRNTVQPHLFLLSSKLDFHFHDPDLSFRIKT